MSPSVRVALDTGLSTVIQHKRRKRNEPRRILEEGNEPILDDVTGPDGEINLAALRQAVNVGFDAAHKVPVAELGIEIDTTDAAKFFDGP